MTSVRTTFRAVLLVALVGFISCRSAGNFVADLDDPTKYRLLNLEPLPTFVPANEQDASTVRFLLYTSDNPSEFDELFIGDRESLDNSHFRPNAPVKLLLHGWGGSYLSSFPRRLKDLYVQLEEFTNIISIDWSILADPDYFQAAENTKACSNATTDFIEFLLSEGVVQPELIHIMGFSLGGQVSGQTGYKLGISLPRITALDPARPLFDVADPEDKVDPSDADFVDVIHTAGLTLSFVEPQGDADFYPNGGLTQPGCGLDPTGSCAHARAPSYMEESVFNPTGFRGVVCESWETFQTGACDNNHVAYMGHHTLSSARGSYFMHTNSEPPYAQN